MVGCRGPRRSSVHFRNISSRRSTIDQAFQFRPSAKIRADVTVSVVFFLHSFRRVFFYVLARSANLPKGLYILLMFFLILKIFFNDRLSNTCFSDANGPIFTKISGLVVRACSPLLGLFRFLKKRWYGKQLMLKNQHFSRTNLLCRAAILQHWNAPFLS